MDAIHYKVRNDGKIINKSAYMAIGINLEGVKNILIASVDGLIGFSDAIKAVFPHTEVKRCIFHQIRNTLNYVYYKHRREFSKYLKRVYIAPTEDSVLNEFTLLKEK